MCLWHHQPPNRADSLDSGIGITVKEAFQSNSVQPLGSGCVNNSVRLRRDIMTPESRKLYRSRNNRMIVGVGAGLADFFGIDPTIVRLLFAVGALLGFGSFILIYIVLFIVWRRESLGSSFRVFA